LLQWLKEEQGRGRRLVLATAANATIAQGIAGHLGVFDEIVCSSGTENLAGDNKRKALVARFGEKGFDYVGNATADLSVWRSAHRAIVVGGAGISAQAGRVAEVSRRFPVRPAPLRVWLKAIRVHQWIKNVLIFVPAMVAHRVLEPQVLFHSALAFLAFSLCASSVYVINDLLDLTADRRHPRKRARPFASGALSARSGLVLAVLLVGACIGIALAVNLWFCAALAAYYVFTWAYSLRLKRAALVDVMTLAGLYTLRIIAGAAATSIDPSFWLLAFSIFVFLCLGVIKRYAELYEVRHEGGGGGHGRGYSGQDLQLLMSMGMSSGYCAIVVIALYINSPDSQTLYRHIQAIWLVCPMLLYWISRMWLLASRGQMDDDPVVFAVRDRISLATLAIIGLLVFLAI
jgi:4-hydroxybenzoate polyprenyltransferase